MAALARLTANVLGRATHRTGALPRAGISRRLKLFLLPLSNSQFHLLHAFIVQAADGALRMNSSG